MVVYAKRVHVQVSFRQRVGLCLPTLPPSCSCALVPPLQAIRTGIPAHHHVPLFRYFDFSGRADGPILRKSLQDIAPRNLLLVQGTSAERADLAAHCRAALADLRTQVLQPGRREPVQLSLPRCITLFLSDQLNMNIGLQRMQRYALAQIETLVGPPDPHQVGAWGGSVGGWVHDAAPRSLPEVLTRAL